MTDCAPAELILAGALRTVARRDRDETSARVALSGTPSACSAAGGSSVATRRFLRRQLGLVGFRRSGERQRISCAVGSGTAREDRTSAGGVQRNVARDPSTRFTPVIRRSS
jgi:hypothetical protein